MTDHNSEVKKIIADLLIQYKRSLDGQRDGWTSYQEFIKEVEALSTESRKKIMRLIETKTSQ